MTELVVAIDGPAGSGKSTVSRNVASALEWIMLDTGAMYRAITWAVVRAGVDPEDSERVAEVARDADIQLDTRPDVSLVRVNGINVTQEIRSAEVTSAVSAVSAVPQVRERLVDLQRETVERSDHGIVIEGRDIGTVVLPDARLKIYLTADPRVRAKRRGIQLGHIMSESELDDMQQTIMERDSKDSSRDISPLKAAPDAVIIDTTNLTQDEVVLEITALAQKTYNAS